MSRGRSRKTLDSEKRFQIEKEKEQAFLKGEIIPQAAGDEDSNEDNDESDEQDNQDPSINPPIYGDPPPPKEPNRSKASPWEGLKPPDKEPSIRLNVDIPISLNDKLAAKARKLRQPKTELVRHLLEWALDESSE